MSVYCLHPGVARSGISQNFNSIFPGMKYLWDNILSMLMNTVQEAAQTSIYCAVEESIANKSGKYYE